MKTIHSILFDSRQYADHTRLPWLDFASGVMILWMVVYHVISCVWGYELEKYGQIMDISLLPQKLHWFINEEGKLVIMNPCILVPWLHFFMPWFFYKSGMFFQKHPSKELWQKDSRKLLCTFLTWSIIGYFAYILVGIVNHTITFRTYTYSIVRRLFLTGGIPLNTPLWFLLTLFGGRLVANKLLPEKVDKNVWIKIFCIVLAGYVLSFLAYYYNHHLLPYWVANTAAGLVFFTLGYATKSIETKLWLIVPCAIIYVLGCIFGFPIVDMWPNKVVNGNYMFWIPVTFGCIVTYNFVCRLIYKHIRVKPLEWIGQNAMTIYVCHMLIISFTIDVILRYNSITIQSFWVIVLILIMFVLLLPVCCWVRNILHT